MLKLVIVLLLVLANGLMFAWHQGLLGYLGGALPGQHEREPERVKRQVNPELVKVLPPAAASTALADVVRGAAAASLAATGASPAASGASPAASSASPAASGAGSLGVRAEPAASAPAGGAASALAPVAASTQCLEAGPFASADLPAAEDSLRALALPAGSWTSTQAIGGGQYLVYMGRYGDPSMLARKQAELRRLKVDFKPLTERADLQPGLVLGRFDTKPAADGALGRLVKRGVRTGRVVALKTAAPMALLRVAAASAAQRGLLEGLKLPSTNGGFRPCTGDAAKA